MGFQTIVNTYPAVGVPGQQVVPGQAVYTAENYVSDGTVKAGEFAFEKTVTGNGAAFKTASATGTGAPVGFVERNVVASITDPLKESTAVYNQGIGLAIALRGQFYAVATGAVTEGQAVLCDPATGAITYGASGAANDTGWIVKLPAGVSGAEGDTVIYERIGA